MGVKSDDTHAISFLTILHVDDDPVSLRMVKDILSAFGCAAWQASSGVEALRQLKERPFDLVLMDINMPEMSGVEVVRRLRDSSGPERDTPVIALTAAERSRAEYRELGFDDFVSKPISIAEFYRTLTRAAAARPVPVGAEVGILPEPLGCAGPPLSAS